jgi:hypothetical protein
MLVKMLESAWAWSSGVRVQLKGDFRRSPLLLAAIGLFKFPSTLFSEQEIRPLSFFVFEEIRNQ